jgi:hypothetical protein
MNGITLLAAETELKTLTAAGTALLIGCVGFVLLLCAFCFYRILREPAPSKHHHAPLDIDTRDTGD